MIRFAVLDDEETILHMIKGYVKQGLQNGTEAEIHVFSTAEEFLSSVKKGAYFDVIFTDVDLGCENGLAVGREVCRRYPGVYLIFITSHPEFAAESYRMEAYQYILKQDMQERVPHITARLLDKIKRERRQYRLVTKNLDGQKLYYADIIYIRKPKFSKYVEYITTHEVCQERITLDQLLKELEGETFIPVERSCIVNLNHIVKVTGNEIHLTNKEYLTVSRARLQQTKELISEYWRKEH